MDKILEQLKDPSWWFSAFFIAIVSSVVAAFLKDWASIIVAKFSSSYRKKKAERIARDQKFIKRLADNFEFLVIEYIKSSLTIVLFLFSVVLFFLVPILGMTLSIASTYTESPLIKTSTETSLNLIIAMTVSFGSISAVAGYLSVSRLELVTKAYKEYRKQRNTQPLP